MRVAFIGLGIMGSRQAANLARAGHELSVYNRTRAKAEAFAAAHAGTRVAATPADAAAGADVVITMVVDGPQVEHVLLGPDGAVHGAAAGALVVDMSTIAPADSRRIATALRKRGVAFVDAPVTGSAPRAQDGTLTIMCGGEAADVERARPLLEAMGQLVVHVGPVGHGEMAKLINNAVAAVNAVTVAEALQVARGTGVDPGALRQVMGAGSGASAMLALKAEAMLARDYAPLFKLEHMLKDIRLCLEAGLEAGVPFPSAGAARELYVAALGRGHGADDFAAVAETVRSLSERTPN